MKSYFWSLCILLLLNSCVNRKEKHHDIDIPIDTITWNIFSKKEMSNFPAKHLVKNKKYIKLDPTDKYLFGAADKILFLDKIYVLDKRLKKIIIFNQEGKGINVLDKVGQGPEEYLQITDFSVDVNGNICMIDGVSDRLIVYNQGGKFVSSEKLPFEVDIIKCLNNGNFMMGLSTWNSHPETAGKRLLITDKKLNTIASFLNFNEYNDEKYWISYYSFISGDSHIYYNKPIDDYIYALSNDGLLEKAYYLDFGSDKITYDWRKDIESNLKKISEKYKSLKNHTIITPKYIIGTLWDKTETKPFLVDRNEKVVYLNDAIAESDISDIVDFINNSIVSLIYPGKYDDVNTADFPPEVKDHLANDNFVVCVTELL